MLAPSYRQLLLNTIGLESYWEFGEASGTEAKDETGRYNGTWANAPTLGGFGPFNGRPGGGVTLNGTNQDLDNFVASFFPDISGNKPYSMLIWVYPTTLDGSQRVAISIEDGGGNNGGSIYLNNAQTIHLRHNAGGNDYVVGGPLIASVWNFLVGTYNGVSTELYVNGVPTGATASSLSIASVIRSRVGYGQGLARFAGTVARPAIVMRELTRLEVNHLHRAGRGF